MSDEQNVPDGGDAAGSPGLRIKIGSQRPEDQANRGVGNAGSLEADQAGLSAKEVPSEAGGGAPSDGETAVAAPLPAAAESSGSPIAAEGMAELPVTFPSPRRRYESDDLLAEIDAAFGQVSIEDLMAGQIKDTPDRPEIEIEKKYRGVVQKVYRDAVLIELPGQQNGVAPLRQFSEPPIEGTELEVIVSGLSAEDQLYELIVPGHSVQVADWSDLAEGVVVEAMITAHNKGGLECEVNRIRGFIPASQIAIYRVEDFESYVGQKLLCVVTEANEQKRNLVLSHRAVMEREREESKRKTLEQLEIGQIREGTVTKLMDFGAFVDIGGIEGLIHISQLSWDRIKHPREVMEEGQRINVRVDKIDSATGKIGLSYRDLAYRPWDGIEGKYPPGSIVKGTVTRLMDFGAFVKLEPGVEGLVHISELSYKRIPKVQLVVQEGQEVQVKVISIDPENQRIALSLRQAQAAAVDEAAEEAAGTEGAEADAAPVVKRPHQPLKGGLGGNAGGEQFGLKW